MRYVLYDIPMVNIPRDDKNRFKINMDKMAVNQMKQPLFFSQSKQSNRYNDVGRN